jgi:hypothetical protein
LLAMSFSRIVRRRRQAHDGAHLPAIGKLPPGKAAFTTMLNRQSIKNS